MQPKSWIAALAAIFALIVAAALAQQPPAAAGRGGGKGGGKAPTAPPPINWPSPPLSNGPIAEETALERKLRLVVVKGLTQPWSMAFLPDGAILVTERPGRLRIVRDSVLDPQPVQGLPQIQAQGLAGLMDLALHPNFAENKLVYFTYHKPPSGGQGQGVITLARGRWDGAALVDVQDICNPLGLTLQPDTGAVWETEDGPNGGDEVNILQAGKNYGWPVVSFGRFYLGPRVSDNPYREGMELPVVYWVPAIAVSGLTFYTGDKFPAWKNHLFVVV